MLRTTLAACFLLLIGGCTCNPFSWLSIEYDPFDTMTAEEERAFEAEHAEANVRAGAYEQARQEQISRPSAIGEERGHSTFKGEKGTFYFSTPFRDALPARRVHFFYSRAPASDC
jgi:hypothetical protein